MKSHFIGYSPVNSLHISRISFPKNTYGGLLLNSLNTKITFCCVPGCGLTSFWMLQMLCSVPRWEIYTVWKVPKYGVISGLYFPVFSPNTEKYRPEINPYLGTFHAVVHAKCKVIEMCKSSNCIGNYFIVKLNESITETRVNINNWIDKKILNI